jgi:uncharacterized membrane protein YdjX (TVP38/TMEM64 family)
VTAGRRIALGVAAALALGAAYWAASETGLLSVLSDQERLKSMVEGLGWWGPLAVAGLIASAIVFTPIPSAPIAVAAGAAYGELWGTAYVVAGSELGALTAFSLARHLGYDAVRKWPWACRLLGHGRSQAMLMAVVFGSRLVPFISFDAVSYAAGLTPLAFWRFAVATLAGVIPVSFLLVHVGNQLTSGSADRIMLAVLALGGVTLIPFAVKAWRARR